jgi:hypothetical protein
MASTPLEDGKPVSLADEYIRKAKEAEAKANRTKDPRAKNSYLATAANWRRFARYLAEPTKPS